MHVFAVFYVNDGNIDPEYDPVLVGIFSDINKAVSAARGRITTEDDSWYIRRYTFDSIESGVTVWDDYVDARRGEIPYQYSQFFTESTYPEL